MSSPVDGFSRDSLICIHLFRTWYKEALQYGFYELDNARRAYTETTSDIGMHHDIFMEYLRRVALLSAPIIPHFAEHIWSTVLQSSTSVQNALFPEPHAVDKTVLASIEYIRSTLKEVRDRQIALDKLKAKAKKGVGKAGQIGAPVPDREKPMKARLYVAKSWPEWQNKIVDAVKANFDESSGQVDDAKVREVLAAEGLLKNKKAMPYMMGLKVSKRCLWIALLSIGGNLYLSVDHSIHYRMQKRIAEFGASTAFTRTLPFVELDCLAVLAPYMEKNLSLVSVEVVTVEEATELMDKGDKKEYEEGWIRASLEEAQPGAPSVTFCEFSSRIIVVRPVDTFTSYW